MGFFRKMVTSLVIGTSYLTILWLSEYEIFWELDFVKWYLIPLEMTMSSFFIEKGWDF